MCEVSYISYGMGVLFCVLAKADERWIVAYEQQDIAETGPYSWTETPFRVIANFTSAAGKHWPLVVVSDTHVVFAIKDKLDFLDKVGIMAKKKVDSLG